VKTDSIKIKRFFGGVLMTVRAGNKDVLVKVFKHLCSVAYDYPQNMTRVLKHQKVSVERALKTLEALELVKYEKGKVRKIYSITDKASLFKR